MIARTTAPTEIYLDANATTPVWPPAAQAAFDAMEDMFGNPSSSHITGLRARYILEKGRKLVRQVLGASDGRIVFTSGATEAIQTGVFSALCTLRERGLADGVMPTLLYGATEHKAVPQALEHWNRLLGVNAQILAIPVDSNGALDLTFLAKHAPRAGLICTMAVNNETGVIHDLPAIERVLRAGNPHALWLVDCVQAIGKTKLNLDAITIDYALMSGHKVYAPKGIGVMYVRDGAPLVPLLAGGGQEGGARGGTENIPGVAAIAAVLECLIEGSVDSDSDEAVFQSTATLAGFRDEIVGALREAFPALVFNAPLKSSVPTTVNFAVRGVSSKELLDLFDAAGVRVSSGSACGSAIRGSYVLEAMGLPQWQSDGAVRISFGPMVSAQEITAACQRIRDAGRAMGRNCLLPGAGAINSRDGAAAEVVDGLVQLKEGSMCSWVLIERGTDDQGAPTARCIVVDPFDELAERIVSLIRCQGCSVVAILDTHCHVDHESCRVALIETLADQLEPGASTPDVLGWPEQSSGRVSLADGTQADFIALSSTCIVARTETPGHTVDHQAYLVGRFDERDRAEVSELSPNAIEMAFTGDTIQIGGIGRTDFNTSAAAAMCASLRRLPIIMRPDTVLCPTHDYTNGFATTLACERTHNSFLAEILDPPQPMPAETFMQRKAELDGQITDDTNCELVCGLIQVASTTGGGPSVDIPPDKLRAFFERHQSAIIIDVREPQEFVFAQNWSGFGFAKPPANIPLTRLANHLPKLLADLQAHPERDVIFLCRSGNRSAKAAEVARRIGVSNAFHILGGIALGGIQREPEPDVEADLAYMI